MNTITLVKDRLWQKQKLACTYVQALLDFSSPIGTLSNLETFYDAIERHVRYLLSLGKPVELYGDLVRSYSNSE